MNVHLIVLAYSQEMCYENRKVKTMSFKIMMNDIVCLSLEQDIKFPAPGTVNKCNFYFCQLHWSLNKFAMLPVHATAIAALVLVQNTLNAPN